MTAWFAQFSIFPPSGRRWEDGCNSFINLVIKPSMPTLAPARANVKENIFWRWVFTVKKRILWVFYHFWVAWNAQIVSKSQSGSKNLWLTLKVWMEVDVSFMSKLLICWWNRYAAQTSLRLPHSCLPVVIFDNNVASNKLHFRCSISTFCLLSTSSPHVSIWYPGEEVADTHAHFVPL